jgi:hypothetical protein
MMRARLMLMLPLVGLLSCRLGTESESRYLTGVIELRSAQQQAQIPWPYLVSMDSIHIDVTSGGGADRHFSGRKLVASDTIVTANTRVLPGVVNVSARVLNARRDTIYAGSTSGTVTTEGFQLLLTLAAQRAVLAVAPDRLTLARSPSGALLTDSIIIYNRGNQELSWQAQFSGCSPNECFMRAGGGTVPENTQQFVVFRHGFGRAATGSLSVWSPRDSLVIPYTVP